MIKIWSMMLLAAVMSGSVVAELALVARSGDVEYRQISAEGGKLFGVSSSGQVQALPSEVRWALEGDLLAHAEQMILSPSYALHRAVVPSGGESIEHRPFGVVFLRRYADWSKEEIPGSIAVVAWLVDGQPRWVEAKPTTVREGYSREFAAMFARELTEEEATGYPVLLLLRQGEFLPPENEFQEPLAFAASAAAHLGTAADFGRALDALETVDVRSDLTKRSLLRGVAETGRLEMVDALLVRGVKLEEGADKGITAMWIAGYRDRVAVVERLLAEATANRGKGRGKGSLSDVVSYGQLQSAMAMVRDGHRKDAGQVLDLALNFGEWGTAKAFLRLKTRSPLDEVAEANLMKAARSGDGELLQLLLKARMRSSAAGAGTTLLIEAVRSGEVNALKVLLEARGNPKIDAGDADGFRAIDYAMAYGAEDMVALLTKAGAATHRVTTLPVTKNEREVVYAMREITVAPMIEFGPHLQHPEVAYVQRASGQEMELYRFVTGSLERAPFPGSSSITRDGEGRDISRSNFWGIVSAVVNGDGSIGEVKVIARGGQMDPAFMESVARNVTATPGTIDGKAVASRVTLPILVESPNGQLLRPDRF